MKVISNIIVLILALLLFGCKTTKTASEPVADQMTITSEVVEIGGEKFFCAFSDQGDQGDWIKEFVPQDQSVKDWKKLVGVRYFKNIESPKDYILTMADRYALNYPDMKFGLFENQEKNSYSIDFIMYTKADNGFVEWDYFQAHKADGKPGIIVNQYAIRESFSGVMTDALEKLNLGEKRPKLLDILIQSDFEIKRAE